jgi:hypothetical protein
MSLHRKKLLRYRISCSSIMIKVFICLGCCSSCSVLDTDCRVHISLRINHRTWLMRRLGRPQPPQQGLHSVARQHRSHRAQPRPQPPERGSDQQSTSSWTWFQSHHDRRCDFRYRRSARFPSWRIVNHNHVLDHGNSQRSHGDGVLVMPDTRNHQRRQERVIL